MNCAAAAFSSWVNLFRAYVWEWGMRCCFHAVLKTQAGCLDVERNTLETQSLTLTQAALLEATVYFVVFQRCDPILFFLSFFMIFCDWELEEIEPGSLLTGQVSCPHPWRGGAGLGQQ